MKEQVKSIPKTDKIDREMEVFYSALGQFNTNIVVWLRTKPEAVKDITKFLVAYCPVHAAECGLLGDEYMWTEATHMCTRKPGPNDLPEEGGGS